MNGRRMFLALLVAGCALLPRVALAVLPTPGVDTARGGGTVYVGTVNPMGFPPPSLPPIDLGPVTVTTTDGAGGAKDVEVHGGIGDAVHFGPGLSQTFAGIAGIDALLHADVGSIHLAASAAADTVPLSYGPSFPGALGENPFFAQALVGITGSFIDVVTVPATRDAPHAGDPTTVLLQVLATCTLGVDDALDLDAGVSASLSLADGTDLGEVVAETPIMHPDAPGCPFGASRMLSGVPVLTPVVLRFGLSAQLSVVAGHDLAGTVGRGSLASNHAFIDALNTGEVALTNADGAGAVGTTGHDYGTLNGGPTITTTTTTTTTSIFVPPSTLPGCTGYCGDGVVQHDCAESCECPMAGQLSVAVCDAATAVPPLAPDCARCAGCVVDLSQCATTTSSTVTTSTTTTTMPSGGSTTTTVGSTTTTTGPCTTVRCILDGALHGAACAGETIPPNLLQPLARAVQFVEAEDGGDAKRAQRLRQHARHALGTAERALQRDAYGRISRLGVDCADDVAHAIEAARAAIGTGPSWTAADATWRR